MNDFQKLQNCLKKIGVPFELTDDSSESDIDEELDTVIIIKADKGSTDVHLFFTREGKFRGEIETV